MDFYERLNHFKKKNKYGNREIGEFIQLSSDAVRMAIKRKSLSELQKSALEKLFDNKNYTEPLNIDPMEFIQSQKEIIELQREKIKKLKEELKECRESKNFSGKQVSGNT